MLDFVIFAFTAIVGLAILLVIYFFSGTSNTKQQPGNQSTSAATAGYPPGWDKKPSDEELGDLKELSIHGSLHQYLLHLHEQGNRPLAVFWWGKQRVVSVCSPELFKDTIKLTYRPKLLFTLFEPLIGPCSIQYANGLDWEERRKALYPTLRDECLEDYVPYFIKIAEETKEAWSQLKPGSQVEIQEEFMMMTIKGITRTCFGNVFDSEEEIRKMASSYHKTWNEMEQRLHVGPPEPGSDREKEFNSSLQSLKDTVMRVVNKRRQRDDEGADDAQEDIPFIDALLQTQVPDEQIVSDALSFMVGGLHTSGYFLIWVTHYLSLHPDVKTKLIAEITDMVGNDRGTKMKNYVYSTDSYMRQVFDETLRVSSLAPYAARYSDHGIVVGGYQVPAGTPIVHALGVSLKNQTLWKEPNSFNPAQCSVNNLKGKAFSPFGMGRRKCPGYLFSYVEVGVFLTVLLQSFSFEPVGGAKEVEKVHGLVTSPKEELYYYITRVN